MILRPKKNKLLKYMHKQGIIEFFFSKEWDRKKNLTCLIKVFIEYIYSGIVSSRTFLLVDDTIFFATSLGDTAFMCSANRILGRLQRPVSTMYGKTHVILILLLGFISRSSSCRASIMPRTANLEEQYGTKFLNPIIPAIEDKATMCPWFFFSMSGKNAWKSCNKYLWIISTSAQYDTFKNYTKK